jgi:glycosyltransferase involved in cell wall biosynthesis
MTFSIITATYNSERYILENLRSIHCSQNYSAVQQIMVDGASQDSTLEIIRSFRTEHKANITIIVGQDKNMYEAINKGMRLINGDIWACLNSDDQYYPDTLGKVASYFGRNPDVDVIFGDYDHVDENGEFIFRRICPEFSLKRFTRMGCYISQPATFLRRSVIAKVGFFDDSYDYTADYDYFIRVARVCQIKHINCVFTKDRLHDAALTSIYSKQMDEETRRIKQKYSDGSYNRAIKILDTIYSNMFCIRSMNLKYSPGFYEQSR